jgi:hypothetical protein
MCPWLLDNKYLLLPWFMVPEQLIAHGMCTLIERGSHEEGRKAEENVDACVELSRHISVC